MNNSPFKALMHGSVWSWNFAKSLLQIIIVAETDELNIRTLFAFSLSAVGGSRIKGIRRQSDAQMRNEWNYFSSFFLIRISFLSIASPGIFVWQSLEMNFTAESWTRKVFFLFPALLPMKPKEKKKILIMKIKIYEQKKRKTNSITQKSLIKRLVDE